MSKLMIILLLLSLFTKQILSLLTPVYQNTRIIFPAHIYRLYIDAGQQVYVDLRWQIVLADLGVYVFYEGSDLINDTPIKKFGNKGSQIQYQTFWVNRSSIYYFRVVNIDMKNSTEVYYRIWIYTYFGYNNVNFYQQANMYNIQGFGYVIKTTNNVSSTDAIITIQQQRPPILLTINNIESSLTENLAVGQIFCLPSDWLLEIKLNMNSINMLYYVNFSMNISGEPCRCITGYSLNIVTQQCQAITVASSEPFHPGAIIGIVFIVFACLLCIGISFLYIRRCCMKTENHSGQKVKSVNHGMKDITEQNMNSSASNNQQICPICLHDKCNVILACKHTYHSKCILLWLRNNNLCPICRKQFRSSHIIAIMQGGDTNNRLNMDF